MTWSTASYVKLLKRAHEEGLVPGIVHSHPRGPARFSRQDDSNEKDLLQLARNRNGDDATLVSILLTGDGSIRARWWPDRHGAVDTVSVRVVGKRLATHTPVPETSSPEFLARQALAFGPSLNARLRAMRIGIAGCGGTGSATAMLLARIGVGQLALFDEDQVDVTNLIRGLADEDWCARGVETTTRIGEVFAHELLRGDTGEPFESIEYDWREHGNAIRGEDDEQPWNAAAPLSGAETRIAVCLAEARYVERRVPFVDLPEKVRQAKAAVDAGDESGWTPIADGPVFRYVGALREDGVERTIPPDLRLRTLYTVELVCAPGRSVVLVEEGLRGCLQDVASKAVESARASSRWRVGPGEPVYVRRIRYDLDEWSDLPVPEAYRMDPFRDSG